MGGIRPRNPRPVPNDYTGLWWDGRWFLNGKETPLAEIKKTYPNIDARRKGGFDLRKVAPTPDNLKNVAPKIDIPDEIEEKVKEVVNEVIKPTLETIFSGLYELVKPALKEGLYFFGDLKVSLNATFKAQFISVSISADLSINNTYKQVERYINNPPKSVSGFIQMLEDIGVNEVSPTINGSIPLLEGLGVDLGASLSLEQFKLFVKRIEARL